MATAKRFVQEHDRSVDPAAFTPWSIEIGPDDEIARGAFVIELTNAEESPIHRVEFVGGEPVVYGRDEGKSEVVRLPISSSPKQ